MMTIKCRGRKRMIPFLPLMKVTARTPLRKDRLARERKDRFI
jgi:hypothetical protein